MSQPHEFWKLTHLSDNQLLHDLRVVLRAKRRTLAELIAHLGEVEERRLHLVAAHGSMFSYCVVGLGMSEDEACRRIELARLARRFPALFPEIADGALTLSVALLLKPLLSVENHLELISAARGKSMQATRELVATLCPSPDVPSKIRKLPEPSTVQTKPPVAEAVSLFAPRSTPAPAAPPSLSTPAVPSPPSRFAPTEMAAHEQVSSARALPSCARDHGEACPNSSQQPTQRPAANPTLPRLSSSLSPLSAQRYKVQFTADASLKEKLERARELSRHAHPSGDFAPIISRALDLLLEQLHRQRFGSVKRKSTRRTVPTSTDPTSAAPTNERSPVKRRSVVQNAPHVAAPTSAAPRGTAPTHECFPPSPSKAVTSRSPSPPSYRASIPRAARRAVVERDGVGCSWVAADGTRCGSHDWVEFDHCQPAGRGGPSEADNLRLLCRAHNLFAAERAYGRDKIRAATVRRQPQQSNRPNQSQS